MAEIAPTILLVEDQHLLASVEANQLESFGYRVLHAATGEEACEILLERRLPVDLVVMDIELGAGKDGIETAEAILEERKLPIVFSTSHTDLDTIERIEKISPYGYVFKRSGIFVLEASIKMGLRLFRAHDLLKDQIREVEDLYDNAPCGYHSIGPDGRIVRINDTELRWLGYSRSEVVGRLRFADLVAPSSLDDYGEPLSKDGSPVEITNLDIRMRRKDSSEFPVLLSRNWILGEDGKPETSRSSLIDNTMQKAAEERADQLLHEKELILREVHHRIKNNMNAVISLLDLKAESSGSAEARAALREAVSQVEGMGFLYERLYRSQLEGEIELSQYLPGLASEALSVFADAPQIRLTTEADSTRLDADRLSTLGIILNELITNSVKYAFRDISFPAIAISAAGGEGRLRLSYEDNGHGLPPSFVVDESPGFGMKLIDGLARQLGGWIRTEPHRGARFVLEFPLGTDSQ